MLVDASSTVRPDRPRQPRPGRVLQPAPRLGEPARCDPCRRAGGRRAGPARHATVGPIVVGVDGSPASDHAVRLAFEEAVARGAGRARRAGLHSPVCRTGRGHLRSGGGPGTCAASEELRHLADDIAAWQEKYPDVSVRSVALDGHTAEVLIGLSSSAQLVVVGTRGHGGFAGLLLGSVGLQLLHHADCPVLIARARETS